MSISISYCLTLEMLLHLNNILAKILYIRTTHCTIETCDSLQKSVSAIDTCMTRENTCVRYTSSESIPSLINSLQLSVSDIDTCMSNEDACTRYSSENSIPEMVTSLQTCFKDPENDDCVSKFPNSESMLSVIR